jgi:hypothetical protein
MSYGLYGTHGNIIQFSPIRKVQLSFLVANYTEIGQ